MDYTRAAANQAECLRENAAAHPRIQIHRRPVSCEMLERNLDLAREASKRRFARGDKLSLGLLDPSDIANLCHDCRGHHRGFVERAHYAITMHKWLQVDSRS